MLFFFFQAEDGIRDLVRSRGLGDVYKRQEKNKYYIDITDDLTFMKDGKHFVWSSEKDGYNQLLSLIHI